MIFQRFLACGVLLVIGCNSPEPAGSGLTDDFGETLTAAGNARRIVSLNPTTTEILFALGAGARLVGRTTYDVFPDAVKAIPDLGPGIHPNVEMVIAARPDLVVLYAGSDNRGAAAQLKRTGIRTAAFRVDRIADFARVTRTLGILIGDTAAATRTIDSVAATLARLRSATSAMDRPRVFWPLWESPLMAVGHGSFLDELLEIAGAKNVFTDLPQPSPVVSFEELVKRDPDAIVIDEKSRDRITHDARWRTLRAVRDGHLISVDSTISIGPSVRLGHSAEMLAHSLHPAAKM